MRDNLHGSSSSHSPDDNKYYSPATFTVWKKSLLFNGEGFTVFDSSGNLVFRVDNYASNVERELFLMDAVGNVLLTLHRDKRLSLSQRWEAFRGDGVGYGKPEFSVIIKSSCWLFSSKALAKVLVTQAEGEKNYRETCHYDYQIEGSLSNPSSFTIFSASRQIIAQVKPKEATSEIMLGDDVLGLVVQPGIDQIFVMGLAVIFIQLIST
eukprot:PITA_18563